MLLLQIFVTLVCFFLAWSNETSQSHFNRYGSIYTVLFITSLILMSWGIRPRVTCHLLRRGILYHAKSGPEVLKWEALKSWLWTEEGELIITLRDGKTITLYADVSQREVVEELLLTQVVESQTANAV
ncbi:MAG: hypothetical protein CMJ46_00530 [Planctomyces sp.]|nr:hypothetical protein [Planctomyces sp.]